MKRLAGLLTMWARRSVGTEGMMLRRKVSRCRRRAVWLGIALAGTLAWCADDSAPAASDGGPAAPSAVVDAGVAGPAAAPGPWARRYYEAYLSETLRGDAAAARTIYAQVV